MPEGDNRVNVVIIGAGLGGISIAINLKLKLGFTNYTIYERALDVGGTWRDNTYPGCGCDVPVHWYSLSSELNPDWSKHYAEQPEILAYWRALASKHQLYPHVIFDAHVRTLTWDNAAQAWNIEVDTNASGDAIKRRELVTARLVVSAAGRFVAPAYSNLEGWDLFHGPMFHSATWDHGVDLKGKRVGVIGNGCSAAQFVPKISEDPSVQVINFCRTANWIVPKNQFNYSVVAKWVFRHIPWVARIYRNIVAAYSDQRHVLWRLKNTRVRGLAQRNIIRYMTKTAPEKYHDKLKPDYPLGCKRIIVDPGYYASLHRPNVELDWGGVKEILKDGLITNDGRKHELDVIIYATGFVIIHPDLRIVGREGRSLYEYFDSRGGPEAYVGTTVPEFPNLFTILGPNTATGHGSSIFSEEQQMEYALQLMRPVITGKAQSFEVRQDVSNAFNVDLQRRIGETTWVSCQSYYRMNTGRGNTGKIITMFPGSLLRFWYLTRKVNWADYIAVGAHKWEEERKVKKFVRLIIPIVSVACAGTAIWKGCGHR